MARLKRGRARREADRDNQRSGLMFWLRLIVVFLIVTFLIVQVLKLAGQSEWRESELDTAVYRFGQSAMLANSEWHRIGRSSPIQLQIGQGRKARTVDVHLNSQGWPLPYTPEEMPRGMNAHACMALWKLLTQAPELTEQGLGARWRSEPGVCEYVFNGSVVFSYRLQNGHLQRT